MALGHVPLQELVAELVRDRAREHPHIGFTQRVETLARSYGDTVDLTVYRCVQESLTNAIRHANAKAVEVRVADVASQTGADSGTSSPSPRSLRGEGRGEGLLPQIRTRGELPHPRSLRSLDLSPQAGRGEATADATPRLELTVRDDGLGFAAGMPQGFGLRGMQERVQALGGEFAIETASGRGTCVRIAIPLPTRQEGAAEDLTQDLAESSAEAADYASNSP
jgi:two-component system sensor histidine kinase UhpB